MGDEVYDVGLFNCGGARAPDEKLWESESGPDDELGKDAFPMDVVLKPLLLMRPPNGGVAEVGKDSATLADLFARLLRLLNMANAELWEIGGGGLRAER